MFKRFNPRLLWRATCRQSAIRIRRAALSLLIAGSISSIGLSPAAIANDNGVSKADMVKPTGGISIIVHRFDAQAHIPFVDFPTASPQTANFATAPLGTHDSLPIAPPVAAISRTSSKYSDLVSSLIATTAMRAGIPLQPILEPFAMVRSIGPEASAKKPAVAPEAERQAQIDRQSEIDQVVAEVEAFNRWWLGEPELIAEPFLTESNEDFDIDAAIDALASTEPIDVQHLDLSPDAFVGSSPMIVTIEEPYRPYDLAARDRVTLPLVFDVNQPIPVYQPDPATASFGPTHYVLSPPWRDSLALPEEPKQIEFAIAMNISPECALDQLIWDATTWADRVGVASWDGSTLGRVVGSLAAKGHSQQLEWTRLIVEQLPSILHRNNVVEGELKLALDVIPEPVADPLPDADPAVFDTAMFLLSEPVEPLAAVLLPVPDDLPNAEPGDFAEEIETVTRIAVNLRDGLLNRWNQFVNANPVNAPEQRVAEKKSVTEEY